MARSSQSAKWKMAAGIALSLLFIYLAFRRADMAEMLHALGRANYGYLLPLLAVIALGLYLRSLRWRYLLAPVRELGTGVLFASLSIGYMANVFMPAHLGEFVRAWHVGKRTGIASGSVFATIVVERLIDVASLFHPAVDAALTLDNGHIDQTRITSTISALPAHLPHLRSCHHPTGLSDRLPRVVVALVRGRTSSTS